jgi:hypothetical protein
MHTMAKPIANPNVTFSPEQLQAVIAQAIAEHEAKKAEQAKTDTTADMDKACIRAFTKLGFKDVQPRVNVLTYNRWIEAGRKVRQGEGSVKVKNLRLFHVSQTDALNPVEAKAALAALAEKKAAKTADKLPKPSPINPAPVAAKPAPRKSKPAPAEQSML